MPILLFLNRFLSPDLAFDSLNYHLFLGHRFLTFTSFMNREFYPTAIHNFPGLIDFPSFFLYQILGYRLSSLPSLISIIGIMLITYFYLDKSHKQMRTPLSLAYLSFFLMVFVHEALFQVATLMVDNLSALLLFAGLAVFVHRKKTKDIYLAGVFLGISIYWKFTNLYLLFLVLPFFGLQLIRNPNHFKKNIKSLIIFFLLLCSPFFFFWNIPQALETNNPVFPFYNQIFRSQYFPEKNFTVSIFGPEHPLESISWPFYSVLNPVRLGETHDWFHDFRLPLLLALLFVVYFSTNKDRFVHELFLTSILLTVSWSLTSGYARYFVAGEYFIAASATWLLAKSHNIKRVYLMLLIVLLAILSYLSFRLFYQNTLFDLSWREPFRVSPNLHLAQLPYLFEKKVQIPEPPTQPKIYLNCTAPSASLYVLSPFTDLPVMNVNLTVYKEVTENCSYAKKVVEMISQKVDNPQSVPFVTMAIDHIHQQGGYDCLNTIDTIKGTVTNNNTYPFLYHPKNQLQVIYGELSLNEYVKHACD